MVSAVSGPRRSRPRRCRGRRRAARRSPATDVTVSPVARLVDVQAAQAGDPVGQQLQRHDREDRLQKCGRARDVITSSAVLMSSLPSSRWRSRARGRASPDVRDDLVVDDLLVGATHTTGVPRPAARSPVLHLAGRGVGRDVRDLLQLSAPGARPAGRCGGRGRGRTPVVKRCAISRSDARRREASSCSAARRAGRDELQLGRARPAQLGELARSARARDLGGERLRGPTLISRPQRACRLTARA